MALPKFNDTPVYELTVPSMKKKVKFRPFLVKEQKILLIAMESRDEGQIANAILETIESCIQEDIPGKKYTPFDIEYIFLQIRSKSVGETATLNLPCLECEEVNETVVALQDIEVQGLEKELPLIKINDQYSLKLRYPRYQDALMLGGPSDEDTAGQFYVAMRSTLDSLHSEDERIDFDEETREEVEGFLDSLPTSVFEEIVKFVNDLPSLTHSIKYTCTSCGHENSRNLTGLIDFFQYASPMRT
jgi:hypothetical protein